MVPRRDTIAIVCPAGHPSATALPSSPLPAARESYASSSSCWNGLATSFLSPIERGHHDADHAPMGFGTSPAWMILDPGSDMSLLELCQRQGPAIRAEVVQPRLSAISVCDAKHAFGGGALAVLQVLRTDPSHDPFPADHALGAIVGQRHLDLCQGALRAAGRLARPLMRAPSSLNSGMRRFVPGSV
jgi:hypothetical protein